LPVYGSTMSTSSTGASMPPPPRPSQGYYVEHPNPMTPMYATSPPPYAPQSRFAQQGFMPRSLPYWGECHCLVL
jgi:hypothetical protein